MRLSLSFPFPPTALRLTKYYVAENTISRMYRPSPARRQACPSCRCTCTYVHTYVRAEARHRSSIDPKRIRGKRARRWINTKTSVTHDQAEPSSAISSCFALARTSPCVAVAFISFSRTHVCACYIRVYTLGCVRARAYFFLLSFLFFRFPLRFPILHTTLCTRRLYRHCIHPAGCTSRSIALEIIQTNYR